MPEGMDNTIPQSSDARINEQGLLEIDIKKQPPPPGPRALEVASPPTETPDKSIGDGQVDLPLGSPSPIRIAQAPTGTMTDAAPPDPLSQLQQLTGRVDDDYQKAIARRKADQDFKWMVEQSGVKPEELTGEEGTGGGALGVAKAIGKDIATAPIKDAYEMTGGAAVKAYNALIDLTQELARVAPEINFEGPDNMSEGQQSIFNMLKGWSKSTPNMKLPKGWEGDPQTVTGALVQGLVQFLLGFGAVGKATGIGSGIAGTIGKGAITNFTFFEGQEANLANLLLLGDQYFPERGLRNAVTEFLATHEDTPEIEGRLKNAFMGLVPDSLLGVTIKLLRAYREFRRAKELAGPTYAEGAKKLGRGGLGPGEGAPPPADTGSKISDLLGGRPEEDIIKTVDTGVPDHVAAKAVAEAEGAGKVRGDTPTAAVGGEGGGAPPSVPPGGQPPAAGGTPGQPTPFNREVYVNWSRINTADDVKYAMGAMADAMAPDIQKAQRGVRSNATTAKAAEDENAWNLLLERRKDDAPAIYTAEETFALRQLWTASGEKLMEVAKAAQDGGPEELFAFRKMLAVHNTIQQTVIGVRTEQARALQQWRMPAGGPAEMQQQIATVLQTHGGENVSRMLAERIAALADQPEWRGAVEEMARKGAFAKTADAVRELWINAILSGPKTHLVNMMSNSAVVVQSIAERAIAARLSEVISPVEGVRIGEASAMMWGVRESYKDAFAYAARSMRTGETGFGRGKLEEPRVGAISAESLDLGDTMAGKAIDALGNVVRIPGRALAAEDEFFKTINYRAELWAQSLRQAMQEIDRGKLDKVNLKQRVAELVADPDESLRLKAADMAAYNTFTNDPGTFVQKIIGLRNSLPGQPLSYIIPFVNTPANILKYTFDRTPLAPLAARFRADWSAGGARRDLAMARMGLGTMAMLVSYDLAMDGHITGSGPSGDKSRGEREALARGGWQRYSIRVPIGEKNGQPVYRYFAYNRMDPIGNLVGMAGDLAEYMRANEFRADQDVEEVMTAMAFGAAQNMMDKTYLFGLSNFIDAMRNPDRKGESWFTKFGSSFIPTTVNEVAKGIDPVARHTWDMISALKSRTPGLSATLPPRLNFWGDKITFSSGLGQVYDSLSPIYSKSTKDAAPIDREFFRLNYFPIHPGGLQLEGKMIPFRNQPEARNRYIQLTAATDASKLHDANAQYMVSKTGHETAAARRLASYGDMTLKETLNAMVEGNHPTLSLDYKAADDDEKVKKVQDIIRDYRAAAKAQVLREFPKLREIRESIPSRAEGASEAPF